MLIHYASIEICLVEQKYYLNKMILKEHLMNGIFTCHVDIKVLKDNY